MKIKDPFLFFLDSRIRPLKFFLILRILWVELQSILDVSLALGVFAKLIGSPSSAVVGFLIDCIF
jgi:hypothetical protein